MGLRELVLDRKHRLPRLWSNRELAKVAPHLSGDVVNVSGWQDADKFGKRYRDYFATASSYTITNYRAEARGFQGAAGEIFLDLEQPLDPTLRQRFDVVFNHTVLEHIFDVETAFTNLCDMSKDVVVVVVPFLQPMHADYGDYWRFTPTALQRMFEKRGLSVVYSSSGRHWLSSVYVLAVASRRPEHWAPVFGNEFTCEDTRWSYDGLERLVGSRAVPNFPYAALVQLRRAFRRGPRADSR